MPNKGCPVLKFHNELDESVSPLTCIVDDAADAALWISAVADATNAIAMAAAAEVGEEPPPNLAAEKLFAPQSEPAAPEGDDAATEGGGEAEAGAEGNEEA